MKDTFIPWAFLDEYRGSGIHKAQFHGTWPTLPEMFRITVSRFPDSPCLTVFEPDRISLSYSESLTIIQAVARWLHSKGINKGDRVAVTGKNSPEWVIAYLAVLFAGATVVPVDYQYRNEELDLIIKIAGVKILFVDEEKLAYYDKNPGGLEELVSLKKGIGTYILDLDGPETPISEASELEIAAILFTSGTMGSPKGVMLTHQNLVADCYLAQALLHVYQTDVFYAILPLHHSYTMLAVFIESISVGAEIVFGKKMVTSVMLDELKKGKITMFLGVPMLFNKILAGLLRGIRAKGIFIFTAISVLMAISGFIKKAFRVNPGKKIFHAILSKVSLDTIRICISGGGPLAPSVFRKFNQLGIDFVQGYGLTETSPIINLNPIEHYKETSVGKVVPQAEMKIIDPDERGIGEIIVKGPMVMKGYFEMPEETAAVFTADGFFKTGDMGYLDSGNYLYLTGRLKSTIITEGGKNVYPEEIENEFQLYDSVEQIFIRGFMADNKRQIEGIEALVYPAAEQKNQEGQLLSPDEVKAKIDRIIVEVNQRLLPYQKINRVILLDKPLEMTSTKKIKRNLL